MTDEQIAQFGRFAAEPPDQATLERFFFLEDVDRDLVAKRRGDHNRVGFALQLVTVRWLGTFLADPLDVPLVVLDYVAAQVEVADPSCVKRYTEREKTRLEHQWEIAQVGGFVSFASAQESLVQWLDRRAWTTGDGPKALFVAAVGWLREGKVLLPGVTSLVELVAGARQAAETRLFDQLAGGGVGRPGAGVGVGAAGAARFGRCPQAAARPRRGRGVAGGACSVRLPGTRAGGGMVRCAGCGRGGVRRRCGSRR